MTSNTYHDERCLPVSGPQFEGPIEYSKRPQITKWLLVSAQNLHPSVIRLQRVKKYNSSGPMFFCFCSKFEKLKCLCSREMSVCPSSSLCSNVYFNIQRKARRGHGCLLLFKVSKKAWNNSCSGYIYVCLCSENFKIFSHAV